MLPTSAILGGAQALGGLTQSLFGLIGQGKRRRAAEEAINKIETKEVDPLIAQRINAPMPGEETARQDIGQSLTQSLRAAKSKKGGLQSITGAVTQANKAKQALANQKAQFKIGAENALVSERDKALKSRQEKQQLKANIALQEVAAGRQNLLQGLSGIGSGLGTAGAAMFGSKFGKDDSTAKDPYSGVQI